ncbi:dual oxidase maturation factor 1-like isoform X1 [Acipenser ruthenus]|uniref:dual oxidase maturation factor 1-like isoform X1 n=1 Tax=Acipenser ruthenus TaxID=7906 RepID=UPI002741F6F7|nr:dual oxidase maturation factor 1-like isoform X1 [Acipenser ruthenus]XP_058854811.1 dual oxidase maturation factor 1-like isoform X1 [Acipenser ruthenus]XP_058854812.1 dual oxidase maturation factor 1-like isoform X1 [Acipenser ruthenus]
MTFYNDIYPFYPQQRTPFIFNLSQLIVILVFLVLACSFLVILPGIRGKGRLFWMFRIVLSLFIGVVTVAVNFTSDWATGYIKTNTTYKSFSNAMVSAEIGLHVGFDGINVTLKGNPVRQLNETINYNEMFQWTEDYEEDYVKALERGLPNPILYIAEKFTQDSPCGLLFQYKYSGQYASATMWTAFCCWLISNVLFSMPVILYGGYMIVTTGAFIIFSLISFATIHNVPYCTISLGTVSLETVFGGSFWLSLVTGILCILIGGAVILMDVFIPQKLKILFTTNEGDEDDDTHITECYLNESFLEKDNVLPLRDVRVSVPL